MSIEAEEELQITKSIRLTAKHVTQEEVSKLDWVCSGEE
jgi:hypothetical protein